MKILFRADASTELGIGHLTRCLALAALLKQKGHSCYFVSLPLPGSNRTQVEEEGHHLLGETELSGHRFEIGIVDHYGLDAAYEKHLKAFCTKVGALDDWGTRLHDADWIIDPSYSSETHLRKQKNSSQAFYSGFEWLLVREEFSKLHAEAKVRTEMKRLLFFFGGSDPRDLVKTYLDELLARPVFAKDVEVQFLVSRSHARYDEFKKMSLPSGIRFHLGPPSVAKIMLEADYYFGSSGTISWERMCLGLPGACIAIVDNQVDIGKTLHAENLHTYLGKWDEITPKEALEFVSRLIHQALPTTEQSRKCLSLVDGKGIFRLADLIEK
jgi:UDP-2,4-diacetamido-2,4,6-trideoxy-beta-L-altropyranose hydrolase